MHQQSGRIGHDYGDYDSAGDNQISIPEIALVMPSQMQDDFRNVAEGRST